MSRADPIGEAASGLAALEKSDSRLSSQAGVAGVGIALSSAMRGAGDLRTPLPVGATLDGIDIVGDYAFSFGHFRRTSAGCAGIQLAVKASLLLLRLRGGRWKTVEVGGAGSLERGL